MTIHQIVSGLFVLQVILAPLSIAHATVDSCGVDDHSPFYQSMQKFVTYGSLYNDDKRDCGPIQMVLNKFNGQPGDLYQKCMAIGNCDFVKYMDKIRADKPFECKACEGDQNLCKDQTISASILKQIKDHCVSVANQNLDAGSAWGCATCGPGIRNAPGDTSQYREITGTPPVPAAGAAGPVAPPPPAGTVPPPVAPAAPGGQVGGTPYVAPYVAPYVPPAREIAPAAPVPAQPVIQREVIETPVRSTKSTSGGGISNDLLIGGLVGAALGFGAGYLAFHQSTPQYPYGYPPGAYPGQSPWQQSPFLGQVPGMGGAMGQFPGFNNFGFQGGLSPMGQFGGFGAAGYPAPGIAQGFPGAAGFVGGGSPLNFNPYGGTGAGLSGFGQTAPAVLPYMH